MLIFVYGCKVRKAAMKKKTKKNEKNTLGHMMKNIMLNKIGFLGLCLLTLISCNNTNNGETSEGNETGEAIGVSNDIEEQIYILLDNKDIWELSDEKVGDFCEKEDCNGFGYAITDLDEDGYIEIIKSLYAGNGHFSWNSFYEVTEEGDVIRWDDSELKECYSQPDLLSMECLPIFANDAEKLEYYVYDFESWGVTGYVNRYGVLLINDNTVSYTEEFREEIQEGSPSYYIGEEAMSEEQFKELKAPFDDCFIKKGLWWFTDITFENLKYSYLENIL